MMAAGRPHAGRDYAWRGARCIILRSGDIAVRNTPAAGRCVRVCALVTSDGIGGTDGFGGTVPLCALVTSDGIGGTVPLGDGRGRVVAGPGSGWGAAGSGMMSSLGRWGPPQHPRRPLVQRPAGTLRRRMGGTRPLADAQQGRRQLPAAAAQGGRSRAGPVAGTAGCTQAEPPAASLPLLCDGMASGSTRPGQGRPPCGLDVAGLHRVIAAAGRDPGPAASTRHRHVGRDAALRASWSAAIVMTAPMRMSSSGSPGKLAAGGGRRPVPEATLYPHKETSKYFPESGNLSRWPAGPS